MFLLLVESPFFSLFVLTGVPFKHSYRQLPEKARPFFSWELQLPEKECPFCSPFSLRRGAFKHPNWRGGGGRVGALSTVAELPEKECLFSPRMGILWRFGKPV